MANWFNPSELPYEISSFLAQASGENKDQSSRNRGPLPVTHEVELARLSYPNGLGHLWGSARNDVVQPHILMTFLDHVGCDWFCPP